MGNLLRRLAPSIGKMSKNQYHLTPEERDERVKLDGPADEAINLVTETGESSESEDEDADWENEGGATDEGPQESLEAD